MSMRFPTGDVVLSGSFGAGTFRSGPIGAASTAADVIVSTHVTAATGTTPSVTVTLEQSDDGTTWTAVPGSGSQALTAAGNTMSSAQITGQFARVVATVTGTTPNITLRVAVLVFAA
jgi:hypothetical protein